MGLKVSGQVQHTAEVSFVVPSAPYIFQLGTCPATTDDRTAADRTGLRFENLRLTGTPIPGRRPCIPVEAGSSCFHTSNGGPMDNHDNRVIGQ